MSDKPHIFDIARIFQHYQETCRQAANNFDGPVDLIQRMRRADMDLRTALIQKGLHAALDIYGSHISRDARERYNRSTDQDVAYEQGLWDGKRGMTAVHIRAELADDYDVGYIKGFIEYAEKQR